MVRNVRFVSVVRPFSFIGLTRERRLAVILLVVIVTAVALYGVVKMIAKDSKDGAVVAAGAISLITVFGLIVLAQAGNDLSKGYHAPRPATDDSAGYRCYACGRSHLVGRGFRGNTPIGFCACIIIEWGKEGYTGHTGPEGQCNCEVCTAIADWNADVADMAADPSFGG
jgi:hypothetical protein